MLRLAALAVLALVLVMRLGPICEAVANASPVALKMAGCESKPKPGKAPQQAACSSPCAAVQASALVPVDVAPPARLALRPLPVVGLTGMPIPPATPPPRTV